MSNKQKYPWHLAPEWAMWAATDKNGDRTFFEGEKEPSINWLFPDEWLPGAILKRAKEIDNIGPCENWKDSLEKRPKQ